MISNLNHDIRKALTTCNVDDVEKIINYVEKDKEGFINLLVDIKESKIRK